MLRYDVQYKCIYFVAVECACGGPHQDTWSQFCKSVRTLCKLPLTTCFVLAWGSSHPFARTTDTFSSMHLGHDEPPPPLPPSPRFIVLVVRVVLVAVVASVSRRLDLWFCSCSRTSLAFSLLLHTHAISEGFCFCTRALYFLALECFGECMWATWNVCNKTNLRQKPCTNLKNLRMLGL